MALPFDAIGTEVPEIVTTVDPERALAYAAATNDENPVYREGRLAPPLFAVVPTVDLMAHMLLTFVPEEHLLTLLHGEQDMFFHQPLLQGMTLHGRGVAQSTRVGSTGTRLVIRLDFDDDAGAPVVEQYFTLFLRGLTEGPDLGPDTPPHVLPPEARANVVATVVMHVDDDQTFRYRAVSGDPNPIHFDEAVAKAAGLPGIIVHGLCTLAMASRAIVETQCDGDPGRLARIAARFTAPAFPGNDLTVTVFGLGDGRFGYEAESGGVVVLTNGLAEVR
jgi:acyl dehydratase